MCSELWTAFKYCFRFHGISLVDCYHVFLNNSKMLFPLNGKQLIKTTKNACANLLSSLLFQELIPGEYPRFFSSKQFRVIRHSLIRVIKKRRGDHVSLRSKGLSFVMSLLQTKRFLHLSPSSFVKQSLVQHKEVMTSKSPVLSVRNLTRLRQLGQEFGVGLFIDNEIQLPTNRSTFERKREEGGYQCNYTIHTNPSYTIPIAGMSDGISIVKVLLELYGLPQLSVDDVNTLLITRNRVLLTNDYVEKIKVSCGALIPINWIDLNRWASQPLLIDHIDVSPVALPEPLKVRVITKSNSYVYLLKLIQEQMTKKLATTKVFSLAGKMQLLKNQLPIDMAVKSLQQRLNEGSDDLHFISGDYDSATDNLPLDVIRAVMEGILQTCSFDLPLYLKKVLLDIIDLDTKPHRIHYGSEQVIQTRGQLMGSFLSFPILCLVNYLTVLNARKEPIMEQERKTQQLPKIFQDQDVLINGDDLLFVDTIPTYNVWKEEVSALGLSLSVGKNYVSRLFGTINSRLLSKHAVMPVLKFGLIDPENSMNILDRWSGFVTDVQSIEEMENHYDFFKFIFSKELTNTNQSLLKPRCLGGPLPNDKFGFVPPRLRGRISIRECQYFLSRVGRGIGKGRYRGTMARVSPIFSSYNVVEEQEKTELWIRLPKNIKDESWFREESIDSLFERAKELKFYRCDAQACQPGDRYRAHCLRDELLLEVPIIKVYEHTANTIKKIRDRAVENTRFYLGLINLV